MRSGGRRPATWPLAHARLEFGRVVALVVDGCIGCGCLSLERCHIVNPGDVVAAEGPGARRLAPH